MKTARRLVLAGGLLAALAPAWPAPAARPVAGGAPSEDKILLPQPGCPAGAAFGGLPVRSARVQTPLAFLPWIQADLLTAQRLAGELAGQPFSAERVRHVQARIGELPFAQLDREARVGGRVLAVVVACAPTAPGGSAQLDLVFNVYAVKASTSLAATWESRQRETAAPEQQGGQEALRKGMRLQPRLGYQAGEGPGAGAAVLYRRADAAPGDVWRTLAFDGYASDRLRDLRLAAAGWHDPRSGPWAHWAWRLGYADQSAPAKAVSRLGQSGLQAELIAQTRPLGRDDDEGRWGLPLRLGAALEAGQHRSGGEDNPAASLVARQHTQTLKLMVGTTARLARHSLAASYGVELGAGNGGAGSIDWVRQVVDIAHQGRWVLEDSHRSLSVDTRLSAGQLSAHGVVPHSARFFAGGREQRFTGNEEWQIRAAPLLRSLGTNALANAAASPGYRRFAALNLTAALPVYNVPLLPRELYEPPLVLPLMEGQLNSATSALANDLRTAMPGFRQAIAHLAPVQQTLAAMEVAVAAAEPPTGSTSRKAFVACREQIAQARDDVTATLEATDDQLSFLFDLLPPKRGSDTLGLVAQRCADRFNADARSPEIDRLAAALRTSVAQLSQWLADDLGAATAAAAREIEPVRLVIRTLFNEMNVVAVSPLLMLDAVQLGPRLSGGPRTRVGLGTGLRVTLVDSVDFSLGYMANLRRQPGEARGAFFLNMAFKDPF